MHNSRELWAGFCEVLSAEYQHTGHVPQTIIFLLVKNDTVGNATVNVLLLVHRYKKCNVLGAVSRSVESR